jgi:hypothetical protein
MAAKMERTRTPASTAGWAEPKLDVDGGPRCTVGKFERPTSPSRPLAGRGKRSWRKAGGDGFHPVRTQLGMKRA